MLPPLSRLNKRDFKEGEQAMKQKIPKLPIPH
jgi:hypothetical protein